MSSKSGGRDVCIPGSRVDVRLRWIQDAQFGRYLLIVKQDPCRILQVGCVCVESIHDFICCFVLARGTWEVKRDLGILR